MCNICLRGELNTAATPEDIAEMDVWIYSEYAYFSPRILNSLAPVAAGLIGLPPHPNLLTDEEREKVLETAADVACALFSQMVQHLLHTDYTHPDLVLR